MSDNSNWEIEAKLETARNLMGQRDYSGAKRILESIADHPQARSWLDTIDQMTSGEEKRKRTPDPYGQDEFIDSYGAPDGYVHVKRKHYGVPLYEDFTNKAIGTLVAYFIFSLLGIVLNIVFLNQARNLRKQGVEVKGIGCLWSLLALFVIIPICGVIVIILLTLVGESVGEVFQNISESMNSP